MSDDKKKVTGDPSEPPAGSPTGNRAPQLGSSPSNPPASPTTEGPRAGHEPQPPAAKPPPPPAPGGKPAPKNPGFITCTVDGKEVVAKPGTNMIEAAAGVGSDIPFYCYHPRLSIAANCRMCLVEVSTAPKLVPACQTPLAEGMTVTTQSAKVQEAQRGVMEFLLLNHPVDCAICDQAGECKLQDYYMRHDHRPSRLQGEKVMKNKRKVLGPLVVLDQERCILCTRCVRFMQEVPKEPQLGVFGRGSHEYIDTFPGEQLHSNYSGNTIDICPVGALLSRDFRFKARAWFLSQMPSICTGCSRGCNTWADFFGTDTYRYRPRENEQINKSWMCDVGRVSYKYVNQARARLPMLDQNRESSIPEVAQFVARKLEPLKGGISVLASPLLSNEDLLAGLAFAKDVLGAKAVYVGGRPSGPGDHYLMTEDKNPNRRGLELIARGLGLELRAFEQLSKDGPRALLALGGELPSDELGFLDRVELLVVAAINERPLAAKAHALLPLTTHLEDEGSFVNLDGIIQRFRKAYPTKLEAQPLWKWISDLGAALGLQGGVLSAREAWRTFASRVPEFAGFEWDKSAPIARTNPGINPLPTGSDGRPAGYREFGIPRVRGL